MWRWCRARCWWWYHEVFDDLLLGECEEVAGFDTCGVEEHAAESGELLGLLQDGLEGCGVGDIYAPCLDFHFPVGRFD